MTEIRIYVACLAAYNDGKLHGRWIDATLGAQHIEQEVAEMLAESPVPDAEEWAIHDFEGFEGIRLSESEDFSTVADLAEAIEEHGKAFAEYYDNQSYDDVADALSGFADDFRGEWDSVEDYARELIDDCYDLDKMMGNLAIYFDYQSFANDLERGGDIWTAHAPNGKVYIFDNH